MKKWLIVVGCLVLGIIVFSFFHGHSRPPFLSKHAFDTSCGITTLGHKFVVHRSKDRAMRNLAHTLIDTSRTQGLIPQPPPHKIHQIWASSEPMPDELVRATHSVQQSNPDYAYALWNPAAYEPLLDATYGKGWRQLPKEIVRDLAAGTILYEHGGIVLDVEMECVGSFTPLLSCADCVIGFEPPHKRARYGRRLLLSPSCIVARAHHPIVAEWTKSVWERSQKALDEKCDFDLLQITQDSLCQVVMELGTTSGRTLLVGPTFFCPVSPQHIEEFHNILDRTVRRSMGKKIAQTLHLTNVPLYSTLAQETLCVHMLGGRRAKCATADLTTGS